MTQGKSYDLTSMIVNQLNVNVERLKKDEEQDIKIDTLLVCIHFYVKNFFLSMGNVQWNETRLVIYQTNKYVEQLSDEFKKITWSFFKVFQQKIENFSSFHPLEL